MKAKTLIASSILAASTVVSSVALAEESPFTGNIGLTSNYIWRGFTLSNDNAAIQGGLDYNWDTGFYVGTWLSNLYDGQYEIDVYGGYGFDVGATSFDVGVITYQLPVSPDDGYVNETYLNFGWQWLSAGVAYTFGSNDDDTVEFSKGDIYLYVGADFELKNGLGVGALYGDYDFDDANGVDYGHWKLYLSKSDFTFAYEQNDVDSNIGLEDPRFTVTYTKSFDML